MSKRFKTKITAICIAALAITLMIPSLSLATEEEIGSLPTPVNSIQTASDEGTETTETPETGGEGTGTETPGTEGTGTETPGTEGTGTETPDTEGTGTEGEGEGTETPGTEDDDPVTFDITFYMNDGSSDSETVVAKNGYVPAEDWPQDPERTGYTFEGWYTADDAKIESTHDFNAPTDLYAHWEEIVSTVTHAVTFNPNGGNLAESESSATVSSENDFKLDSLPTPTRDGYTFDGWYTAETGGELVTAPNTFPNPVELYAHWTQNITYTTVTFNANGGNLAESELTATASSANGFMLSSLPTPTRDGYTFDGWYTAKTGGELVTSSNAFTSNTDLFARWSQDITYRTITLDPNGGTLSGQTTITVSSANGFMIDQPMPTPTAPSGMHFVMWNTQADGQGVKIDDGSIISGDMRVYAYYKNDEVPVIYYVTFHMNDGSGVTQTKQVENDAVADWPAAPTRTGWRFLGWFTQEIGGNEVAQTSSFTSSTDVYAHWEKITYTITFDANGGTLSGSESTATVSIDNDYKLSALPVPSRAGYIFDGWFDAPEGGTAVTTGTTFGSATTVYAHWTELPKVFFDPNGGTFSGDAFVYTNTSKYLTSLPTVEPVLEGYTFDGWFDAQTGGNKIEVPLYCTQDTTVYAQWTKDEILDETFTITFDAGEDATLIGDASMTTNQYGKLTELPTATKDGYAFDCWLLDGARVTLNTKFDADAELQAQWIKLHTITFDEGDGATTSLITNASGCLDSLPAAPTREGYTFDGWFDAAEDGNAVTTETKFEGDATVYAHWTENPIIPDDPDPVKPDDPDPVNPDDPDPVNPDDPSTGGDEPSYPVLSEGTQTTWTIGSASNPTIHIGDTDPANLESVVVSGITLVRDVQYLVRNGSIIIEFLPAALDLLGTGTHSVVINYKDGGKTTTGLTIAPKQTGEYDLTDTPDGKDVVDSSADDASTKNLASDSTPTAPQTGDERSLMMLLALMVCAMFCMASIRTFRALSK